MALAVAFDTLKIAHHLRKGGLSEEHAGAITEAIKEASIDSDLATKSDVHEAVRESERRLEVRIDHLEAKIDSTRVDLEAKIDSTRADLEAKIDSTRADLEAKISAARAEAKADAARLEAKIDAARAEAKADAARLEAKIDAAQAEAKADIIAVRTEMREMEQRLIIKLGAMLTVAVSVIAALVKFL